MASRTLSSRAGTPHIGEAEGEGQPAPASGFGRVFSTLKDLYQKGKRQVPPKRWPGLVVAELEWGILFGRVAFAIGLLSMPALLP